MTLIKSAVNITPRWTQYTQDQTVSFLNAFSSSDWTKRNSLLIQLMGCHVGHNWLSVWSNWSHMIVIRLCWGCHRYYWGRKKNNPRDCLMCSVNKMYKASYRIQLFTFNIYTCERQGSASPLLMLVTHSRHDDIHNTCVMYDGWTAWGVMDQCVLPACFSYSTISLSVSYSSCADRGDTQCTEITHHHGYKSIMLQLHVDRNGT